MLRSIKGGLEKYAGTSVLICDPTMHKGELESFEPEIVVLLAGDYLSAAEDAVGCINKYTVEARKRVCLIGYKDELLTISKYIAKRRVWKEYERPLDNDKLIADIIDGLNSEEEPEIRKQILVVDDSATMLSTIKHWLSDDYSVSTANSATNAFAILAKEKPDLILLDYDMPICSGAQFLEMLRSEATTRNIPVIFLTSLDDRESVSKVLSLRPEGYLLKSLPRDQIVQSVENFFSKLPKE